MSMMPTNGSDPMDQFRQNNPWFRRLFIDPTNSGTQPSKIEDLLSVLFGKPPTTRF